MKFIRREISKITAIACMAMAAITIPSCNSVVYDYLDPCPQGVKLRFIYDYNMEFANAFPSQVDCLTLLVYDADGRYITSYNQSTDELLSDENWRLVLDLVPGDYIFEAWGGMECASSSFHFNAAPESQPLQSLQVGIDKDKLTFPKGTRLHPLFFGQLSMTVPENSMDYTEGTVEMKKDTNNFRLVLQSLDGYSTDGNDFIFTITDDNSLLNYDNGVIPQEPITYYAWTQGKESMGILNDSSPWYAGYAELSTSRLLENSNAVLKIYRRDPENPDQPGLEIVKLDLIWALQLLQSQEFAWMDLQQFLDRESRWDMVFFLDNGLWTDAYIQIGPWVVRLNDAEFTD